MSSSKSSLNNMSGLRTALGMIVLNSVERQEFRAFSMLGQAKGLAEQSIIGEKALIPTLAMLLKRGMTIEEASDPGTNPELSGVKLEDIARAVVEKNGLTASDRAFWSSGELFRNGEDNCFPLWAEKRLDAIPEEAADLLRQKGVETVAKVIGAPSPAEFAKLLEDEVGSQLSKKVKTGALAAATAAVVGIAATSAATPLIAGFVLASAYKALKEGRTEKSAVKGVASAATSLAKEGFGMLKQSGHFKSISEGVSSIKSMRGLSGIAEKVEVELSEMTDKAGTIESPEAAKKRLGLG